MRLEVRGSAGLEVVLLNFGRKRDRVNQNVEWGIVRSGAVGLKGPLDAHVFIPVALYALFILGNIAQGVVLDIASEQGFRGKFSVYPVGELAGLGIFIAFQDALKDP